jgi:TonB family protein
MAMSSVAGLLTSCLVNSVWEILLVGGAGWLVCRGLRRLGPRVEHVVWVSTLLLAIVTPLLPFLRWLMELLRVPRGENEPLSIVFAAAQNSAANAAGVLVIPATFLLPLFVVYLVALLYFAARLGWSLYWTDELLRGQPVSLGPEKEELWQRCRRAFGVDGATIVSARRVTGPVTLGVREPVLVLPLGFAKESEAQDFLAAVAHECAHMQRRDFQKNLLYEAASLAIAFHPVTWMLKSQIAQTREMICDGMATERLINSRSYTQSLLRLAAMIAVSPRVSTTHAIGIFDANILEERIMRMHIRRRQVSSAVKYGLVIPATLFLLSVAAGGAAMALVVEPQATSSSQAGDAAKPYGQVYRLGKDVSAPVLIHSEPPEFPASAQAKKGTFDGKCLIALVVDASGMPHDVHVKRSLGSDFDASAIKAVQQYRFTPAKRAGEPVAVALLIEVDFQKF